MCDSNVKSERILTKLCALDYKYICEKYYKILLENIIRLRSY